jgi:hypothetical protein
MNTFILRKYVFGNSRYFQSEAELPNFCMEDMVPIYWILTVNNLLFQLEEENSK